MAQHSNFSLKYQIVNQSPHEQVALHEHHEWKLSLILQGAGTRTIGDQTESFKSGEVVLLPPGLPHQWVFDAATVDKDGMIGYIQLYFSQKLLDTLSQIPELSKDTNQLMEQKSSLLFTDNKSRELSQILVAMERQDAAARLASFVRAVHVMGAETLHRVVGHYTQTDVNRERLAKVKAYVERNYNKNIYINEVADYLGMNYSTFCTFFRRWMGRTFTDYLNEVRIRQAALMIKEGASSSEVASLVGYNSVSYFAVCFRKRMGITPREYGQRALFMRENERKHV